jgi:DNA polymerase-3 subunit gamma/tau
MLSSSAFNAFLKTLEEPPSYAIFILATTEKHKVLPTILSRCQIFDFNRIGVSDIASHLKIIAERENVTAEDEALHLISQKADGALRDALSLFDLMVTYSSDNTINYKDVVSNLHILDYDYYFRIVGDIIKGDSAKILLAFDEILKKGFDEHNFILGLTQHFRDLILAKDPQTLVLLDVTDKIAGTYQEQAALASSSLLMTALHIGNQCDLNYKSAKNQRLHVEVALMKMAYIPSLIQG